MLLLKNANVYAPKPIGVCDILIIGGKIIQMEKSLSPILPGLKTIDLTGKIIVPGFIDQHVHITGGGGEGGLNTRTPALKFSDAVAAGVTTIVGLLGTDGFTQSVESLVAKTKELNLNGITAYCLTGSYAYPSITLTGSVARDIVYLSEVLGVKIAMGDHRASHPTEQEIIRLASDVRMAGLIGGKPGIIHIHMGVDKSAMEMLIDIVEKTDIPIWHFRPTHLGRMPDLAAKFTHMGGYSDITAGAGFSQIFPDLVKNSAAEFLTVSSDSNGSMPKWNDKNEMIGIEVSKMTALFDVLRDLIKSDEMSLENALPFITTNVAKSLNLYPKKGIITQDSDADITILDKDLAIDGTIAKGVPLMLDKKVLVKGMFE